MTILFAGSEMGSFSPSDSTVIESTSSSYRNTSFTQAALKIPLNPAYAISSVFTSATDFWLHFEHAVPTAGTDLSYKTAVEFLNSSGTALIRMQNQEGADTWKMEYWNGSAWTLAGAAFVASMGDVQTIDINCTVNTSSGSIKLYLAGTERVTSGTIDLSGIANIARVKFYGRAGTGTERFISQVIGADEVTIGMRLMTLYASGVGSDSAWGSGTYASIDEAVYNDVDFISSASANQVQMVAGTPVSALTGYAIKAVVATARAKRDATGPHNIQMGLRVSGSNYFSSTKALDVAYTPIVNVWGTSPATGVAWTAAELTGLQFGVKSIT